MTVTDDPPVPEDIRTAVLEVVRSRVTIRFALTGPGRYSLDAVLGIHWVWTPALIWIALGAGVFGGVVNLVLRRPPAAQAG